MGIPRRSFQSVRAGGLAGICTAGLIVLAGCGSSASSPATPTLPPATAAVSPTPPVIRGTITFGTVVSGGRIQNANTTFKKPRTLAWLAHFNPKPSTGQITVTVTRIAGVGPHPENVWETKAAVKAGAASDTVTFTKQQLASDQIVANHTFSVAYTQAGRTLAEGTFQISSSSGGGTANY